MPDEIEPTHPDAARVLAAALIGQALALDRVFKRAFVQALRKDSPHRHARRALKAQAQCHKTLKILIALKAIARDSARSSEGTDGAKKFSDSNEATIENAKAPS